MNIFAPSVLLGTVSLLVSQLVIAQEPDSIWVSIDPVAAKHYKLNQTAHKHSTELLAPQASSLSSINFMRIKQTEVANLSEFMHDNYHRCGGFVAHESLLEAQLYTEQLAKVQNQSINSLAINYTIDNAQTVQTLINNISPNDLTNTVNSLSAFNNRYYSVQSGVDASQWLKDY